MDGPCTSRDDVTSDEDIVNLNTTSSASDKPVERDDNKNAETLSDETKQKIAATLINEARYGRNGAFKHSPEQVTLYNSYYDFYINYLIHILAWFNLALAIFEKPAVSGFELPHWATLVMEFVCIFVFGLCLFYRWYIAPDDVFKRDTKNIILAITIIVTILDMLQYIVLLANGIESVWYQLRWSRILRPVFVVCLEGRQVRRALRNIRKTIFGVIHVLVLLLLAIALFTLLATKLFQNQRNLKDIDGNPYFQNYFESFYQLYILTTTANSPDVGIPAYDSNNWFALFFIVFLVICMYMFFSILLGVVYAKYKSYLESEIRNSVHYKRRHLISAFNMISEKLNGVDVLTFEKWVSLLHVLCPKRREEEVKLLWEVLDCENNNYIKTSDFIKVSELLNMRVIEVKKQFHLLERKCPKIYLSWLSMKIRKIVCHRYFTWFFDVVIFANAVFIALSLEMAEAAFLVLFGIEIALKIYTFGWREFFMSHWNKLDLFLIGGSTIAFIVELSTASVTSSQSAYDFLMILRVLRLVKIIGAVDEFRIVVDTIIEIGPSIIVWGQVVFLLLYMYAILGMELFQGRIRMLGYPNATANVTETYCGDVKLKNSEFYNEHYCGDNFNNILKSMKILFDLMVVNQWHILAQGFELVTSKCARLYFVSFHLICVILVLNIFVAFIVEVFMKQYKASRREYKSKLEKAIRCKGVGIGRKPITERSRGKKNPEQSQDEIEMAGYGKESERKYRLEENQINTTEKSLQQMFDNEAMDENEDNKCS